MLFMVVAVVAAAVEVALHFVVLAEPAVAAKAATRLGLLPELLTQVAAVVVVLVQVKRAVLV
jgi:hypothetical protein